SLTHDSIIIQIPYLQGRRRTELEQLLALFDQSSVTANPHFLTVDEDELPERYRPLLRRLQKAVADPVVRETMEGEDDIIEEIKDYQRLITSKEQIIEAKDKAIEAKQKRIERAVLKSYAAGTSIEDLAEIFDLSAAEVADILKDAR
ncbi:MAG: hypothetical protein JNK77_09340, partial [Saprospiraceae bacterium]|nr:hypothetical protein [Saprospiraceae bacterium]